jgi:hypothetical protein
VVQQLSFLVVTVPKTFFIRGMRSATQLYQLQKLRHDSNKHLVVQLLLCWGVMEVLLRVFLLEDQLVANRLWCLVVMTPHRCLLNIGKSEMLTYRLQTLLVVFSKRPAGTPQFVWPMASQSQ